MPRPPAKPRAPRKKAAAAAPLAAPAVAADDLYLFHEGRHLRAWEMLGAHPAQHEGIAGVQFSVWAPNAREAQVIGEFNGWSPGGNRLAPRGDSGIWQGFVAGIGVGTLYKYAFRTAADAWIEKADPFALACELAPRTASVVADLAYGWGDAQWMAERGPRNAADAAISIYEVHLGSWARVPEEGNRSLTYREMAPRLIAHLERTGFTHVELLPVMEHPFYGSWGYQVTGYYAPTSRYGSPQDFKFLVDQLHQHGYGVILDWVPSHFPNDPHGLAQFDGTALYEHADPRQGFHPDWHSCIFNYGRREVRSFLLSNALFWLEEYHADGLRVDAVASMLYLDYSRKAGEWIPNVFGGRENLEAISFLRELNEDVYRLFPAAQTIAEDSTAWPMVSRPIYAGGMGFGMKWDMGWMHDTLAYFAHEPVHRKFHHGQLTFRQIYAFQENFVLPLSHDEVVHGKASLLAKMPGDEWQRFANLRLLLGYQFGQSGKKMLFMGDEFGQGDEWNHEASLPWHLLEYPLHAGVMRWVADLNRVYRATPALHELDFDGRGFAWVDADDALQSTLSWRRRDSKGDEVLVVCNFTPVVRGDFRVGVPRGGEWRELLNSDSGAYGGSDQGNLGVARSTGVAWHGQPDSLSINLPPLAAVFFAACGD